MSSYANNKVRAFYEIYENKYRPPEWLFAKEFQEFIWKYANMVTVFYDKMPGLQEKTVRKIVELRLPTYIPKIQSYLTYNKQSLYYHYKYNDENLDFKEPAEVNAALFCIAPTYPDLKYVHVLAVYGPKMHTTSCPDYKTLMAIKSPELRQRKYIDMVADCFRKVRAVYVGKGYRRLIIHGFGGMGQSRILLESMSLNPVKVFRKLAYKYLADLFKPSDTNNNGRELWFNELGEVFPDCEIDDYFGVNVRLHYQTQHSPSSESYPGSRPINITHPRPGYHQSNAASPLSGLSTTPTSPPIPTYPHTTTPISTPEPSTYSDKRPIIRGTHISIKDIINGLDQNELDKTLIIINWDRYSILGNGHRHDNSIAAQLGSISAVSILSYPFTNPDIKYVGITTANKIEPQSI